MIIPSKSELPIKTKTPITKNKDIKNNEIVTNNIWVPVKRTKKLGKFQVFIQLLYYILLI